MKEKRTCWKIFSYMEMDRQPAEEQLNAMAAEGWRLEKIRLGCLAKFRRAERAGLRYYVDFHGGRETKEDEEYRALCREAGWALAEQTGHWDVYESLPDTAPEPIQTDPAEEYRRYKRVVVGWDLKSFLLRTGWRLLSLAAAVGVLALGVSGGIARLLRVLPDLLLQSMLILPDLLLILTVIVAVEAVKSLIWGSRNLWRLAVWRRDAADGRPLSPPDRTAARVLGGLRFGAALLELLCAAVAIVEMLVQPQRAAVYLIAATAAMALGLFFRWKRLTREKRRTQTIAVIVCAAVAAVTLIKIPLRWELPSRIPKPTILEECYVEKKRLNIREDALLGSRACWLENDLKVPEYKNYGGLSWIKLGDKHMQVYVWTFLTPELGEWAFARGEDLEGMTRVGEGLWTKDRGEEVTGTVIYRTARGWVKAEWGGSALDEETVIARVAAWAAALK